VFGEQVQLADDPRGNLRALWDGIR
jgi:hypothetical protein